jgi:hypothetical protein
LAWLFWFGLRDLVYAFAKIIGIAKGFSLVNELCMIKKCNLLKFKLSWGRWYYHIKNVLRG